MVQGMGDRVDTSREASKLGQQIFPRMIPWLAAGGASRKNAQPAAGLKNHPTGESHLENATPQDPTVGLCLES